uniref:rRNA biogenesis protein RRP5 n=1 Tax=Spodoptera frugiperda TaxID=7108 RepID=A0A2H1W1Z5_SPOFR
MTETEEYFPRGGKKPTTTYFKQSANFLGAPEKGEKKKKRPKKKAEGDDGYLSDEGTKEIDQSFRNCANGLSYKTVKEGLLVLGRVKTILETKVVVSLPCRLIGSIMACHISEPYNKLLEAYVNDKTDKVLELGQLFRPGQYIAVKVLEVKDVSLMLSTMPQHVNGQTTLKDLQKGNLIQAAVSSVEDHGYVMDIGVPNTTAFLPKANSDPEIELDEGMICWCSIKSAPGPGGGVVTLSNELVALQNSWLRNKTTGPMLPGSNLEFLVDTPLDNGIEGHVFKDLTAYVQRQHADTVKGKKPTLGQKVRARLLYVMPTRNTPFLTMRNIFASSVPDLAAEQQLQDGQVIEDAKVLKITGRSIHFRLGGGCYGTMSLKRIQVDEDLADEEVVAKSYPIGSTHKVRVMCYNLSDYVHSVTDQPDVIAEKYFSLEQLHAGDLVDATVKTVADNHVLLNVGRVTGYVSQAHLSDSGILTDTKKPSTSKLPKKKYKVGQTVKARVLVVDPSKQTLFLTLKPSLLSPDLEILDKYDTAAIGKAYTGVIKTIREYILVQFFNNVVGYVPSQFISKEPLENVAQAFHIGQIVKCTILRVNPEENKMSASFVTPPFTQIKDRTNKRKQPQSDEVPNKKNKNNDEPVKDKKKKTKEVTTEESETEDSKELDKKKKKKAKLEQKDESDEDQEEQVSKKTKKRKTKEETTEGSEADDKNEVEKKKKKKKTIEAEQKNESDSDVAEQVSKKDKKKKNKKTEESNDEVEHKKKDKKKKVEVSEESDAIETDLNEEVEILTPQDQALVDLSTCTTGKQYKRRVVALLKAVNNRRKRVDRIERKIARIEERGLTPDTKLYHTAMQNDRTIVKERLAQLLDALGKAQAKLKDLGVEFNKDYKKEKRPAEEDKEEKNVLEVKVVESLEPALEAPSAQDFWTAPVEEPKPVEDEEDSSSEDEDKEQPKKKRKKLTVAEKLAKLREEEEKVREMEKRATESENQPRSSEQFERALLAHPNSSQLWIAYMAFHLQATDVEKARNVGRKALSTISFRDVIDKFNVYVAMLSIECRFGTKHLDGAATGVHWA